MSKKLLLADDSVTIQKVVELVLADEGFEIRNASDGQEALEILKEFRPDIVLADVEMPKMNGYQLCEKIKSDPETKDIPVILLAGAFEPIDEELLQDVKANDYLVKPFESEELISKINALLAEREMATEESEEVPQEAMAEEAVVAEASTESIPEAEEAVVAEAVAEAEEMAEAEEVAEIIEEPVEEETSEAVTVAEEAEEEKETEELAEATSEELSFAEALGAEETKPQEEVVEETKEEAPPETGEPEMETAFEIPPTEEQAAEEPSQKVEAPQIDISPEEIAAELKQRISEIELPSKEQISETLESTIQSKVDALLSEINTDEIASSLKGLFESKAEEKISSIVENLDIKTIIEERLDQALKEDIKRLMEELAPRIIEETVKRAIEDISESIKQKVENIVWETVPDLAETIITKEIEKIKSSF